MDLQENVTKAIVDQFAFNVANNTNSVKKLAIIPAYLQAMKFESIKETVVKSVNFTDSTVETVEISQIKNFRMSDPYMLNKAGYSADVVLTDETAIFKEGADNKTFAMSSADASKTIYDFLTYIKTNPTPLKEMHIFSNNKMAFNTMVEVVKVTPFSKGKSERIDLNRFFSRFQNQDDRICVDFKGNELELSDDLLMTIDVHANTSMQIAFTF